MVLSLTRLDLLLGLLGSSSIKQQQDGSLALYKLANKAMLKLLDSKNGSLQHNAAFALYGIAENEDNVSDFIRVGGVQKLQDGQFIVQEIKDCVAKTLKIIEEKIYGRVLKHLLYLMQEGDKAVQRRTALALAHLCSSEDQKTIFIDSNGWFARRVITTLHSGWIITCPMVRSQEGHATYMVQDLPVLVQSSWPFTMRVIYFWKSERCPSIVVLKGL